MSEQRGRPRFPEGNRIPPERGGTRFNIQTDPNTRIGIPTRKKNPFDSYNEERERYERERASKSNSAVVDAPPNTITKPIEEGTAPPAAPPSQPIEITEPAPLPSVPSVEPKKPRIGTKTRIALAILAAEGTGAVINEQFNDQPVSTASVAQDLAWPWNLGKSAAEDIQEMFNRNKTTETVFDNSASKGTLSGENTIIVSNLESLQGINTISQSSEDGHAVNILMPLQGMPPSGKVEYSRELVGKNSNNPIYASESRRYALENGIENEIVLKNIPAGYTILAPVDGEFLYNRIGIDDTPEGTINGPVFFFKDKNGILYQISISDASGKPLSPILDVPFRTMKDARDDYRKFLHPIKKGEPIATLLQQGDIDIFAQAWPSGQSGLEEVSPGNVKYVYPININFITHLDPSTGEQKLVISK